MRQGQRGWDVLIFIIGARENRLLGRSEVSFVSPNEPFSLGVPSTRRRRWMSLAVENFGLGITEGDSELEEDLLSFVPEALGLAPAHGNHPHQFFLRLLRRRLHRHLDW